MRFGINYLKWANIFERVEDVETRKASSFVTNQATKEGSFVLTSGGFTNIVVRKSLSLEALKARGVYQYGRIPFRLHTTYELSPEKDRVGMSTTGFPKVFIADDMTYTLPPAAKKTSVLTWILLGIGLGLVVLIGIGVWWWFRKRKLNNKTKTPSAEERLVAVSDDQQGGESRLIGQSREVAAGSSS